MRRIGLYYHTIAYFNGTEVFLPGYLGVFIDELARNCEALLLYLQTSPTHNDEQDYILQEKNIKFNNLGNRTPAWERDLFHRTYISQINPSLFDYFIIRSPTPLAPYFNKSIPKSKLVYFVVGDYSEGRKAMKIRSLRDVLISLYLRRNHSRFIRAIQGPKVIVNSPELYNKLKSFTSSISLVRTTTLVEKSFSDVKNKSLSRVVRILYTGRFDWAKGLQELAEAIVQLNEVNNEKVFELHVAGWQLDGKTDIIESIQSLFRAHNVSDLFINHGKKKIGNELNSIYRKCDIYVIPSYHEGFPRTIWEAMAQSLPVIATKVGAIPHYLENNENALLIEPKKTSEIVNALNILVKNESLRFKLMKNAMRLARENTLENQTKKLIQAIYE